jgi:signal transduction histidine kinase
MQQLRPTYRSPTPGRPLGTRALLWVAFAGLVAHVLWAVFDLGGSELDSFFNDWVYNAVLVLAVAICVSRAVLVRAERAAWLAISAGLAAWAIGDIYWTVHLADLETIPYPSLADGFYLAFYPCLYAGMVLFVRARVMTFHTSQWLDGAIGALAVAAVGSALLYPAIRDATGGDPGTVATNLAYPLGDVLLLSFVACVLALLGWRPGRAWAIIAAGLIANAVADGAYLYAEATSGYVEGTWIDSLWLCGFLLLAFAAWESAPAPRPIRLDGLRTLAAPCFFSFAALTLVTYAALDSLPRVALGLAAATLLAVVIRMMLTFGENAHLVAATERAARAKTDFLASMSHELRTPLTAIIGFSELLHDGDMPEATRQKYVGRILARSGELRELINDVLDLAKVEAGMTDFAPEAIDLESLVDEVMTTMRVPAKRKEVDLEAALTLDSRRVVADSGRLKQVLYNYLSNAIKFTPPGGRVTLRIDSEGMHNLRLSVEDTGVGIKPEDQQRVFKEFQQLEQGPDGEHHGTGLGLALVKRIVEAQGGRVGLDSTPGEGSVFFAVLPGLCVDIPSNQQAWPALSPADAARLLPSELSAP